MYALKSGYMLTEVLVRIPEALVAGTVMMDQTGGDVSAKKTRRRRCWRGRLCCQGFVGGLLQLARRMEGVPIVDGVCDLLIG